MIGEEGVDLLLLDIDPVSDILERKRSIDDDVLDASHVETSPFFESFSYKQRNVSLFEDLNDLLSGVLAFFTFLLVNTLFVNLFPQFAH